MADNCSRSKRRLTDVEMMANTMLNTLANSGAEIDDTPMILKAQDYMRQIAAAIERAVDRGEVTLADVFDRNYRERPGSNPKQYDTAFLRNAQTSTSSQSSTASLPPTIESSAPRSATRMAIFRLTVSARSQPQGDDPVWNDAHCRNRRILMDDQTRFAHSIERTDTDDVPDDSRR